MGPLRVGTIQPGLVDSDTWDFLDDEPRERLRQNTRKTSPVRRIGQIENIGHAAAFLMTNPYVTGAVPAGYGKCAPRPI
ncbi:MAG: SDR family oxidoreductase [Actinomycetota bacterium]|nr:SDR family oxidoreductase [Actinomycetota bacterium]